MLRDASARLVPFVAFVAAVAVPGCGDDAPQDAAPTPAGPPSLSIETPSVGSCVTLDAEGNLRTKIAVQNWMLRPPGFCGVYPQCGYAVFFVDDTRAAESSSLATDVPLGLGTPAGGHTISVELHDDAGEIGLDADGAPLRAEAAFTIPAAETACP